MNIKDIIVCPVCRGKLEERDESYYCLKCSKDYPLRKNKIYFLEPNKEYKVNDWLDKVKRRLKKYKRLYSFLINVISPVYFDVDSRIKKWMKQFNTDSNIIDVGSGVKKFDKKIVNLDIFDYEEVDILADATKLPFKDNSIDGVINIAVLEHVKEPKKFVSEFNRVLKKGGKFFVFVPFLQGYHASPHDYYRWTYQGCKELFNDFGDVKVEVSEGPTSSLLWIFQEWFAITFSFYNKYLYRMLLLFIMGLTFPVKYLDVILRRHCAAKNVGAGFYIIGQK